MATTRERNITLKVTGDVTDVQQKVQTVTKDASALGVTLTKELTAADSASKKLTRTLTFTSRSLQKLKDLQNITFGKSVPGTKTSVTVDKEAENREASKRIAARKAEEARLKRIRATAATARLSEAKRSNAAILNEARRAAGVRKTIALNGANSTLGIKAAAAEQERGILAKLQKELTAITTKAERLRNLKNAGAAAKRAVEGNRTKAQIAAQRKLNTLYEKTNRLLSNVPKKLGRVGSIHKSWVRHVTEIVGVYRLVNFGINTLIQSIKSIPKIGIELQTTQAVLASTLGSTAAAAGALEFLTAEADRAGKSILGVRENFRNLNASMSLAGETTETVVNVFSNLNTISTALHLSSERTQHTFLAIAQIFNKTKVQSEELVKQLGNLLPGAFASFARSMEISTRDLTKLLNKGLVSSDRVPKFLEQMAQDFAAAFVIAERGLQASTERMNTSFTLLGETIFKSFEVPLLESVKALEALGYSLTSVILTLKEFSNEIGNVLTGVLWGGVAAFYAMGARALFASKQLAKLAATIYALRKPAAILTGLRALFTNPLGAIIGTAATVGYLQNQSNALQDVTEKARELNAEIDRIAEAKLAKGTPLGIEVRIDADATVQALQEQLDSLNVEIGKTKDTGFKQGDTNVDRNNALLQQAALVKNLAIARRTAQDQIEAQDKKEAGLRKAREASQAELAEGAAKRKIAAEVKYQNTLTTTEILILKIQGKTKEAAIKQLQLQRQKTLATLTGSDAATVALREEFIATKDLHFAKIEIASLLEEYKGKQRESLTLERSIKGQVTAGVITELEGYEKLKLAKAQLITDAEYYLALQEELAGSDPGTKLAESFKRAREAIEAMKLRLKDMKPPLTEIDEALLKIKESTTSALKNAFVDFITGAKTAKEAMISFGKAVVNALINIAAQQLAEQVIEGVILGFQLASGTGTKVPAGGGGGGGGGYKGSPYGYSNTNVAAKGASVKGLSSAANTILDRPTLFPSAKVIPFASGGVLAGEAGAEAVLPLARNSQGKLGVSVEGQSSGGINIGNINVYVESNEEESSAEQSEAIGKAIIAQLKLLIQTELTTATRSGGQLNPTQLQATF